MTVSLSADKIYQAFMQHKRDAKKRRILFTLSYKDWLAVWAASGKLHLRGCKKGQYVMHRFNDAGPYSVDNVAIISCEHNHLEGTFGKRYKRSAESCQRISFSKKGKPSAFLGKTHTPEAKEKMRQAAIKRYENGG